jgi:hypothetical protein
MLWRQTIHNGCSIGGHEHAHRKAVKKDDGGQELFISAEMSQYWSFDV